MTFLTGAHPDSAYSRKNDADASAAALLPGTGIEEILQPVAWVRNQRSFPSCVGQAVAAAIEGIHQARGSAHGKVSGVSIWREARRRQRKIESINEGTRVEYALGGLVKRGWDPYREGEDIDKAEAGSQDDLADELFADDTRLGNFKRFRVRSDRLDQIDAALATPTFGVIVCMFLRADFFRARATATQEVPVLTVPIFGGGDNSHAMRVFGRRFRGGRREYALQNSWGATFGGVWVGTSESKVYRPGCVWVDEGVIANGSCTHDVHCLEVKL